MTEITELDAFRILGAVIELAIEDAVATRFRSAELHNPCLPYQSEQIEARKWLATEAVRWAEAVGMDGETFLEGIERRARERGSGRPAYAHPGLHGGMGVVDGE